MDFHTKYLTEAESPGSRCTPTLDPLIRAHECSEKTWDEIKVLLHKMSETLARVESRMASPVDDLRRQTTDPAYSISQAAITLNLSESHLRRAIYKGDLRASNVGSTARPLWRIMQSDLIAWLESKKGGDPKIPPRSDLKALIDRHLPGLRGRKDSATR